MTWAEGLYERIFSDRKEKMFTALSEAGVGLRTLDAMKSVPRVSFVDWYRRSRAYEDEVVPIGLKGEYSTVSQPLIVGQMTDMLKPQESDCVLEIGAASGYQAAVLSKLARRVVTAEVDPSLVKSAKRRFSRLGIDNVEIVVADGTRPFVAEGSFDKMLITAAMFPSKGLPFFEMLKDGGICVAPVGGWKGHDLYCRLVRFRKEQEKIEVESVSPADQNYFFVLLQGHAGFENVTRFALAMEHEGIVGKK